MPKIFPSFCFYRCFSQSFSGLFFILSSLFFGQLWSAPVLADNQLGSGETIVVLAEGYGQKQIASYDSAAKKLQFLTEGSDWHLYPDISPDGKNLAFVQGPDHSHLKLVVWKWNDPVVSPYRAYNEYVWPNMEGFLLHPRWSQNGRYLFISIKNPETNKQNIMKLDFEKFYRTGKAESFTFADIEGDAFFASSSSDGQRVIFQRNSEGRKEIILYNTFESDVTKRQIVIDEGMSPSISKDDRLIAYTKKIEQDWEIFIYNNESKTILRQTFSKGPDFAPHFDRHGKLLYASNRSGQTPPPTGWEEEPFSIYQMSIRSREDQAPTESSLVIESQLSTGVAGWSFYAPKVSGITALQQFQLPDMQGESRSSFGSIEHQGKIYVVGGHQGAEHTYPPESFTGRLAIYDAQSKTWSEGAERPHKAHGFSLAAFGQYIYAFGGFAYEKNNNPRWKSLSVVDRYNIVENKWETVAKLPRARSSNVVAQVGSKVYLIGGWDSTPKFSGDLDGTFHSQIDVFDLSTETTTTLAQELPLKRRAFTGVVSGQKIFLIGGISEGANHFALLDDVTMFNTDTGEFKKVGQLPYATFAPAAGLLGNTLFMFGGMVKKGQFEYDYVAHVYSAELNSLKARATSGNFIWMNTGRELREAKGFSQVVTWMDSAKDGQQYLAVLGGHHYESDRDTPVNTVELFTLY